jgi:putative hemin transport protein
MNIEQLRAAYAAAREADPKMRIRDLATTIGTSEAQLVALGLNEPAVPLRPMFKAILLEAHTLGHVMGITRNDNAVHERHGVYSNVSFEGPVGLAVNPDIDLRLFMAHWTFGFAVTEGERRSLQFFDKSGEAVHKIYLTAESDGEAFDALVAKYRAEALTGPLAVETYPAIPAEQADAEVDAAGFQDAWRGMKDSHEFFMILRNFRVARQQAMRLAPEGFVRELSADATVRMLEAAAADAVPIMVFVANRGCIQIHTGNVEKLMPTGPWFNVLDPKFNLHLRQDKVATVYLVRKPSTDGDVHSIEAFDAGGNMIIQFFGSRKPGVPELQSWRDLVADLPLAEVTA